MTTRKIHSTQGISHTITAAQTPAPTTRHTANRPRPTHRGVEGNAREQAPVGGRGTPRTAVHRCTHDRKRTRTGRATATRQFADRTKKFRTTR